MIRRACLLGLCLPILGGCIIVDRSTYHCSCTEETCLSARCTGSPNGSLWSRAALTMVGHELLSRLHRAASEADFDLYFDCYTPDAVFLGTDATERWTLDEFKAYARPHFDAGKGWTYTLIEDRRFLEFSADGNTAWFDEALHNAKLGECRGTGVMVLGSDGRWRIAHYNLTMPVPNAIIESIAERIRAGS